MSRKQRAIYRSPHYALSKKLLSVKQESFNILQVDVQLLLLLLLLPRSYVFPTVAAN